MLSLIKELIATEIVFSPKFVYSIGYILTQLLVLCLLGKISILVTKYSILSQPLQISKPTVINLEQPYL